MADQSFGVRITANIAQYKRALAEAKKSTRGFASDADRLRSVGARMSEVGATLTRRVTLPLVAAGTAAGRMFMGFDQSMTRIQALVGVSASEVEAMRDRVLELSGETARSPQELADALFFITSAGLEGSAALEALEASAKAAAIGLGDTATIADAVTSAMNAYGEETLNAEAATDALVAAVRLGKLEPAQLAQSIGRVLPIASAMGVEYHEVAAAMAAMSRTGTDANEAATQLVGIMSSILSPTVEAADALATVGLSSDRVQRSLAENGLLATLQLLTDSFGGNASATADVFGNIRALTGVLDMLGSNAEGTAKIFADMTDTVGEGARGFAITAETDAFKASQAWVEVQATLVAAGETILPLFADFASAFAKVISAFTALPEPVQQTVITLLAFSAAAGPVLSITGKLVSSFDTLKGVVGAVPPKLLAVAAAVGVAIIAYQAFTRKSREIKARTSEVAGALVAASDALDEYARAAAQTSDNVDDLAVSYQTLSKALLEGDDGEKIVASLGALGRQASDTATILIDLAADGETALTDLAEGAGVPTEMARQLAEAVNEVEKVDKVFRATRGHHGGFGISEEYRTIVEAMEELQDQTEKIDMSEVATSFLNSAVAADAWRQELVELAETEVGASRTSERSLEVFQVYGRLLAENGDILDDTATATDDYNTSIDHSVVVLRSATVATSDLSAAAREARNEWEPLADAAEALADSFDRMIGPHIDLNEATRRLIEEYAEFSERLGKARADGDKFAVSLNAFTESGRANQRNIESWVESIINVGEGMVATGTSIADATTKIEGQRVALIDQLDQWGFNRSEVEAYIDTLNFTPATISTTLELAEHDTNTERLRRYLDSLQGLSETTTSWITTRIDEGALAVAQRTLDTLAWTRTANIRTGILGNTPTTRSPQQPIDYTTYVGVTGVPRNAFGGYSTGAQLAVWGEAGPELMLPLSNPSRLDQLLADPRGLIPISESLARLTQGGTSPTTVINNHNDNRRQYQHRSEMFGAREEVIDEITDRVIERIGFQ